MGTKKETPLMKQYKEIKEQYKDAVLFFRLGDFYEMFFNDAVIVSKELGLTLTSRNKEKGVDIPMAGVPYHSSANYISKLVQKGYKVAICEQVEDPKEAKGIVKREVVKVVTPGTVIDTDYLDEKSNNYLLGLTVSRVKGAIAYLDITTGEFRTTEVVDENSIEKLINEINKISPQEIIIDQNSYEKVKKRLDIYIKMSEIALNIVKKTQKPVEFLCEYFGVVSLESFGLLQRDESIKVSAMTLEYVLELHKYKEIPVNKLAYLNKDEYMELNLATQKNLELVENPREKSSHGTLLWVLDYCKTSMGTRYLKHMIKNPLLNIGEIRKRQDDIAYFIDDILVREDIKEKLKNIYDIERLIGKIILGTENGRDLIALKKSVYNVLEILHILGKKIFHADRDTLIDLYNLIDKIIVEEPPFSIREGNIIKRGYHEELDQLHKISKSGKDYLLELEGRERERTGIKTLKVKYNKVFGYFIEVTKSNVNLVPDDYTRKQTLANAERYITPELKDYESKILNAKDKIEGLEYELFKELSSQIKKEEKTLQEIASGVAYLDCIISFAQVAIDNNYIKPELTEEFSLEIEEGRHAIVEKLIGQEEYVRNSVVFDNKERIVILTGPNMAGKSTYMKQVALIILMAQVGSYVPAKKAIIPIVDKIFTRVGASDDLVSGQSTFMVEMSEVANIVNNATEKSFIILDEVGRGTSTFDGISIASAITEYIDEHIKAKTIFATHYHELTDLEEKLQYAVNFRIEVLEGEKEVVFLREIKRGGADKSYGIEVARLAGLPKEILRKSKKTLKRLEERQKTIEKSVKGEQLALFGTRVEEEEVVEEREYITEEQQQIIDFVENLNLNKLTPIDALMALDKLKKML